MIRAGLAVKTVGVFAKKNLAAKESKKLYNGVVSDCFQKTKFFESKQTPLLRNIKGIVIDSFGDIMHGEVVESIVKGEAPYIKVKKVSVSEKQMNSSHGMARSLQKALDIILKDRSVRHVNLSAGNDFRISDLSNMTGLPLNKDNLFKYKDEVRKILINPAEFCGAKMQAYSKVSAHQKGKLVKQIALLQSFMDLGIPEDIKKVEAITSRGVKFYLAAGNEGKNVLDPVSFARGVTNVGAFDGKGKIASYSANNSLVSRYEIGAFNIHYLKGKFGKVDYQVENFAKGRCPEKFIEDTPFLRSIKSSDGLVEKKCFADLKIINKLISLKKKANNSDDPKEVNKIANALDRSYERLGNKLIPVKQFVALCDLTREESSAILKKGNFISADGSFILNLDSAGKVLSKQIDSVEEGTSFASPEAMHIDMMKDYWKPVVDKISQKLFAGNAVATRRDSGIAEKVFQKFGYPPSNVK